MDGQGSGTTVLPPPPHCPAVTVPGFEPQGFPVAERLQHPSAAWVPLSLLHCRFSPRSHPQVRGGGLAAALHRRRNWEVSLASSLLTLPLGCLQSTHGKNVVRAWF